MISLEEGLSLVLSQTFKIKTERIGLASSYGRVLAENIQADRDYPPFNRSAMDGYAVRTAELEVGKEFAVISTVFAGDQTEVIPNSGEVVKIMTGAPVPVAFDVVVRVEDSEFKNGFVKFSDASVQPWQNIAKQGEDLRMGAVALPKGQLIGPPEVTLLASLGRNEIEVVKSPKVMIISTGNEIMPVSEKLLPHQIRDSNSYTLESFLKGMNIHDVSRMLVADNPSLLKDTLTAAMDSDLIILSGGVSMGEADFVPEILKSLGVNPIFHKVKLKPGKPLWFGKKEGGPVVFGLPGNPFSCQVAFKIFIQPFLQSCMGAKVDQPLFLRADFDRPKKGNLAEFFPCKLENNGGDTVLRLCSYNGSGDVTATAMSDGLACHSPSPDQIYKGDLLAFYLWR